MSTHLKNGMTTDDTGKPVFWVVQYLFAGRVSTCRRIWNFYCENRLQLTAVYCHRRGGVKGIYPAPHIHEHLRYTIMATALRTPSRITTSRLSTLR